MNYHFKPTTMSDQPNQPITPIDHLEEMAKPHVIYLEYLNSQPTSYLQSQQKLIELRQNKGDFRDSDKETKSFINFVLKDRTV